MSKEYLKALECLEELRSNLGVIYNNTLDNIEQALLKAQEQEKLFDDMLVFKNGCLSSCFEYKGKQIVAMPLEEYTEFMKQEKALEIIKEKDVDIYILNCCKTVNEYNFKTVHIIGETRELTQEEFNLLKEVLE